MVSVEVLGVHVDPASGSTIVLLGEGRETTRVLPIFIGPAEAQAIVLGLQRVQLPRPGTHDIIVDLLERLHARPISVVVTELREATFFAELEIDAPNETVRLSIRPSDGIALATRTDIPIYVEAGVLDLAAVEITREPDEPFDEAEVESIVSEFQDFLSTAEPEDFDDASGEAEGGGSD